MDYYIILLDINIKSQPRNRRSESKYIYIFFFFHLRSTRRLLSALFSRDWDTPQIKRGANGDAPKEGSPREIKISFGRNDSAVTKYTPLRVSNFCLRYSMFRCRKGGKDPTPRKEGAGNPSKSAGHMLEERETRVLYYSRAAPRYNVNPPLRFLIRGGSGLLLALVTS